MSEYDVTLVSAQQTSDTKGSKTKKITLPRAKISPEYMEYLKKYEPDTFERLNEADNRLSNIDLDNLKDKLREPKYSVASKLGAVRMPKPEQVKTFWQKFEGWFAKLTGKTHINADDICDAIDKGSQIWDLSNKTTQTYGPIVLSNS